MRRQWHILLNLPLATDVAHDLLRSLQHYIESAQLQGVKLKLGTFAWVIAEAAS